MNALFLRLEAFEPRLYFQPCPLGTAGRILCHRLRRIQRIKCRNIQTLPSQHDQRSPSSLSYPANPFRGGADSVAKVILSSIETASPFKNLTAKDKILLALRRRNPDLLLRLFLRVQEDDPAVICSIPRTTFSEILQLLNPGHFVDQPKRIHDELSSLTVEALGIVPIQSIFTEFVSNIRRVVEMRRLGRRPLGINDYASLLNCARACGDAATATAVWNDMNQAGVLPNTACYNHYMAAKCFPSGPGLGHRHTLRVIPYNLRKRAMGKSGSSRSPGFSVGRGGIRSQVMQLFDDMVLRGLGKGDLRTFCYIMIALAREGDIAGVKSVLNRVWGVDVDALLRDEESLYPVKTFRRDSPLFPNTYLLFAIAHAFGSNNDIPTALRIVDYVSRQYSIAIPRRVWAHLMEWTFVLSVPRFGQGREEENGALTGKLPLNSVESLWVTMAAEPYNVKPTMAAYNRYIKSLILRQSLGKAQEMMRKGLACYELSAKRYRVERRRYLLARSLWAGAATPGSGVGTLWRRVHLAEIETRCQRLVVERWVRLLIKGFGLAKKNPEWEREAIPNVIREWRDFLPEQRVCYGTTGGVVTLRRPHIRGARRVIAAAPSEIQLVDDS
ncbi:MAG: hypothetical protein M1839_007213 [Geoglossum umbratile]|nr:MAG: hypothetical protein M1839_007213 [Geoglossum umbratile]